MVRTLVGLLRLSMVGLAVALALVVAPAAACGCGAYIPREGEARVAQERALIRWDGSTEDIVMELGVEGRSREAAWILPLPSRATVQLGDARLLHAAHANASDERRTLITLWYQPDLASLPERIQAQLAAKIQQPPDDWPRDAREKVQRLLARYEGNAAPYGRSLYRPRPAATV